MMILRDKFMTHSPTASPCGINPERATRLRPVAPEMRRSLPRSLLRRSEEHTSELQSLMRISYAVFCLKKKKINAQQLLTHTSTVYNKTPLLYDNKQTSPSHQ